MTVLEAARQSREIDWRRRCEFFLLKAAIAVKAESGATPNHVARVVLADLIFIESESWASRFAFGAATNATILAAASLTAVADNDLEFTINSIYDAYTTSTGAAASAVPTVVTGTLTRPANTTTYAAGDELTDVGGAVLAIPGCARVNGGSGFLDAITVISSQNATTDPSLDVMVFDATSVPQADNAAFAPSDAVMNTIIAAVGMGTALAGDAAASGNLVFQARNLGLPFACGANSTSLFVRFVVRNGYVPVASEVFVVRLGIRQA